MAELRRIGVVSVMKIFFVIYLMIGFLVGLFVTFASLIVSGLGVDSAPGWFWGPAAIIVLPLVYGILGALFSGLGALVYNFLAGQLGGVQVLLLFPVQDRQG